VLRIDVKSACQMRDAVMRALPGQDVFIGVAAVADYRPRQESAHKIKKGTASPHPGTRSQPRHPRRSGGAAGCAVLRRLRRREQDLAKYAEGKRVAKKLALVVGNLVQDGLGGDSNAVTLFDATGAQRPAAGGKVSKWRAASSRTSRA
jgi:phosphopantothenoylcysteine decarboxylase/phosphopantothenate--cysteine ligase